MTRKNPFLLGVLALATVLAGCGDPSKAPQVTMTVEPAPLQITIHAEGDLKAIQSTPMGVPGPRRSSRQLVWALPDGSRVTKGEVVARFSADQSKQDLAQALIDLALNQLTLTGKQSDLAQNADQLDVNLAQVATQLATANRYANATIEAIARNQILDAVADRHYLTTKQGVLEWQQGQLPTTDKAALAVIGAQRNTIDLTVQQKRDDVDALELRAPHAGILMLQADWNGQKPQVGASFFAGREFATLPNLDQLEVVLQVPQIEAQGIHDGLTVELHPLGAPAQLATAKVSFVAAAAAPISSENPVKYLAVKVAVPVDAVRKYDWMPGMRFAGMIVLLDGKSVLSVPNLALDTIGSVVSVHVLEGGKVVARNVKLGVMGPARSQIVSGLKAGDQVVLLRANNGPEAVATAAEKTRGAKAPGAGPRGQAGQREGLPGEGAPRGGMEHGGMQRGNPREGGMRRDGSRPGAGGAGMREGSHGAPGTPPVGRAKADKAAQPGVAP